MKRVVLDGSNIVAVAEEAGKVLRAGGIVLYPTDTLYGLGAGALSDSAVAKIYAIKGRREDKPIHAIVDSLEMAEQYGVVDENARVLAKNLPSGKVTFILKKKDADTGIAKGISTFGFRIPDHAFCCEMLRAFGAPITATSANRAGEEPLRSVDAILAQLGETAASIDLVIDAGELPGSLPSTVIDLSLDTSMDEGPAILREGAVPIADVWEALRIEP